MFYWRWFVTPETKPALVLLSRRVARLCGLYRNGQGLIMLHNITFMSLLRYTLNRVKPYPQLGETLHLKGKTD